MGGINLATAGVVKRSIDDTNFQEENRDWLRTRRTREDEAYGIESKLRQTQFDEAMRQKESTEFYRKGMKEGKSFADLSKIAFDRGDMKAYGDFKNFSTLAKSEGMDKVVRLAYDPNATGADLVRVSNAQGNVKIDDIKVEDIKDKNGNVVDRKLTAYKDGKPVRSYNRNAMAVSLGIKPAAKYSISGGMRIDETSGEITPVPEAKDKYLKIKDVDGAERLFDVVNGRFVTASGEPDKNSGISYKSQAALMTALRTQFKISDIESITAEQRPLLSKAMRIATQLMKKGAVDPNGVKLTEAEAMSIASDVVDGRMTEEAAIATHIPKGGAGEKPPMKGAKRGVDENGQPAWFIVRDGKTYKVVPGQEPAVPATQTAGVVEPEVPTTEEPGQPAAAPGTGMAGTGGTVGDIPVVGGIMRSAEAAGEVIGDVATGAKEAISTGIGEVKEQGRAIGGILSGDPRREAFGEEPEVSSAGIMESPEPTALPPETAEAMQEQNRRLLESSESGGIAKDQKLMEETRKQIEALDEQYRQKLLKMDDEERAAERARIEATGDKKALSASDKMGVLIDKIHDIDQQIIRASQSKNKLLEKRLLQEKRELVEEYEQVKLR